MDATFPLVPIANLLACLLVAIPLIHIVTRSWNTGVYIFALWSFLSSFTFVVNTIVWANDVKDRAPVWCDISSHLQLLTTVGRPACSLIITRRIYKITRLQGSIPSKRQKRVELALELALCIGIPFVVGGLYYIVQDSRYQILEEMGCSNAVAGTGLSVILISSWTILFPFISLVCYTPRIILTFFHHRREMNEYLDSGTEGLSQSHFYRMLILGCFDIFITLPIEILLLVLDIVGNSGFHFEFYPGWSIIHSNWGPVFIRKSDWAVSKWVKLALFWDEWINPFYALVFFALFGLTPEARDGYRKCFRFLTRPFSRKQDTCINKTENLPDVVFNTGEVVNATLISSLSTSQV